MRASDGPPTERGAHGVAVHHWQISVEHDHVVSGQGGGFDGAGTVDADVHRHPDISQTLGDGVRQDDMVLHDENSHRPIFP